MDNTVTLVLADANEELRGMLAEEMAKTGEFDVVGTAADGQSALRLVLEKHPQLLLTDLLLPELDGFALIDRIRELEEGKCSKRAGGSETTA